jgi:tetratricopeptide (TPR) repeat protein
VGKITKRSKDQACEIEFRKNKLVSVRIEGEKIIICEIGLFDAILREVCTKDIKLYDDVINILVSASDLESAVLKLNNLYLDGQRRTMHEKDIKPEEKLSNVEVGIILKRNRLRRWEAFEALADSFYGAKQKTNFDVEEARESIFEALGAYVDVNHPDHKKVCTFLLTIKMEDPLHHQEDGLSVLRDMVAKSVDALNKEEKARVRGLFRRTVRRYRITLRNFFYDPLSYPNDIDSAETWIEEAGLAANEADLQMALSLCIKAIHAAPNYLSGYYQAVHYCVLKRDFEEAIRLLEAVKDMPMANKILANRKDYYLLYLRLCSKMPTPAESKIRIEHLNELAQKYGVDLTDGDQLLSES